VKFDPRLREIHQGEWQGVLIGDIRQRWPDEIFGWENNPWHHHPPGGERLQDLQSRVLAAFEDMVARHPGDKVAVFTHKLPIVLLKIHFQGHAPEQIWSLLPANAAWEIFEVNNDSQ
jgi:broad specificity phosphatase PhoE